MNKKLKTIEVGLIGCGDAVTLNASDTATEPIATYALDEFKAEKQMSFKDDGKEYFVPFHAVDHIYVSESETSVADRPNPYGCEPSGDTDTVGEVWFTSKTIGECSDNIRETELAQTSVAKPNELLANPSDYDVKLNGINLSYVQSPFGGAWTDADETMSVINGGEEAPDVWAATAPCDITDVEVTVAHK